MSTLTFEQRAVEHAPKTADEMRIAVRLLLAQGQSDYGVAAALRIAVEEVRRLNCFDPAELARCE